MTLGVTPWACCARYVRYTRTGFPHQTRPPSRSSRRRVAEPDKSVKGRNSGAVLQPVLSRESEKLDVDITGPGVALAGLGGLKRAVGAPAPPVWPAPPIRRRSTSSPFLFATI